MAARDVILIGVLIFAFGVGFFILNFVMTNMVDEMSVITEINESNASLSAFEGITKVVNRLDYVVFGLFIGLVLALIITGWFVGGHPIFMFIYFIVMVMAVILSVVLSNVWYDVSQASVFGTTILQFPVTNHLLLRLPFYSAIVGFIGFVVMFAKPYFQDGY